MLDHFDATRQPVGIVDNELAGPIPRKTGVLGGDHPQDKQRKETGVARKTLILAVSAEAAPAAVLARTPRGVGISESSRGRGHPRRPLTPPYVRFRIRRFMKDTGVVASYRAATPAPDDQRRTSGRPRSCGWRHCSTTARAG